MSVEALAQLDAKLHHNLKAAWYDHNVIAAAQLGDSRELVKRIDALFAHDDDTELCGYLYLRNRHLVDDSPSSGQGIPDALNELLQAFPSSIGLNYLRCEINSRSGDGFSSVLTDAYHLALCIERDPDNSLFWHKLAIAFYFGGLPMFARVAAMAASSFAVHDAFYSLHAALCHVVSGNEQDGRDLIDSMPTERIGMGEIDLYIRVLIELNETVRAKSDLTAFTKAYTPLSQDQAARLAAISERIDSGQRYAKTAAKKNREEQLDPLLPQECPNLKKYFSLLMADDLSSSTEPSEFLRQWVDSVEQSWTALDFRVHLETRLGDYAVEERLRYLSSLLRKLEEPRIMRNWHVLMALSFQAATSVPQREPVDHLDAQFASITETIAALYQDPFAAPRVYELAVSLQNAGMYSEAVGVFTVAYQLQPEVEFIISRLCCSHEELFQYGRILDRIELHQQKFPLPPVLVYYKFNAYLKQNRLKEARLAYEAIPSVEGMENPGFMPSRAKSMLELAERLHGKVNAPLRYWNSVYNDSLLTMLSPYGYETMSGFYGTLQDDFSLVRGGLERLKVILAAVGWQPPRVICANDPRSEVLGGAAAALLGCEAVQLTPEAFASGGLIVVFSIELANPADLPFLFRRTSNTALFSHLMAYTNSRGMVADVVSIFAELPRCPWFREYFEGGRTTPTEKFIEISPVKHTLEILNSSFEAVSAADRSELEVLARSSAHMSMVAAGNRGQNEPRMRFWYDFPVSVARFQGSPNLSAVLRIGQRYQA
jgi:hypothetical protein